MRFVRTGLRLSMAAALIATPAVAFAQSSTGVDNSWLVAYKTVANPLYGSPFVAYVVNPTPTPPWVPNNPGVYQWIGADPSGTVDPTSPGDGTPLYDYLFTTTFNLAAPTTLTFECAMDNSLGMLSVNGGPANPGGCGVWGFGSAQTLLLGAGSNTLSFHVQGDGKTDGLVMNVRSAVVTTPEPASLTLLATGLVGIVGAARRRRQGHHS